MASEQKSKLVTAESLAEAWQRYERCFGDTPHGTVKQLAALLVLAHTPAEDGWVRVSERLPECGAVVLFYVAAEGWIESGWLNEDGTWQCERTAPQDEPIMFENRDERVTHWRPLPAPPGKE